MNQAIEKAAQQFAKALQEKPPKTVAQILVYHQRMDSKGCLCGWSKLGASHPEHIESVLREAGKLVEE